jgi:hypothetical protein
MNKHAGKCTCGGEKARTGHSDWCDIHTEPEESGFEATLKEYCAFLDEEYPDWWDPPYVYSLTQD